MRSRRLAALSQGGGAEAAKVQPDPNAPSHAASSTAGVQPTAQSATSVVSERQGSGTTAGGKSDASFSGAKASVLHKAISTRARPALRAGVMFANDDRPSGSQQGVRGRQPPARRTCRSAPGSPGRRIPHACAEAKRPRVATLTPAAPAGGGPQRLGLCLWSQRHVDAAFLHAAPAAPAVRHHGHQRRRRRWRRRERAACTLAIQAVRTSVHGVLTASPPSPCPATSLRRRLT